MQKKLIALALASLAGSAFAQSNVTIYGVADATYDYVGAKGGATEIKKDGRISTNSSYIGFKGVEDLGNGLKAVFQFENAISFDAGTGTWANRDSFVGVSGGFGTVVAGTLTAAGRALGAKVDVNSGATGVGFQGALFGRIPAGRTGVDDRTNNAIAYVSPNFSGFSGLVAWGAGSENKQDTSAAIAAGPVVTVAPTAAQLAAGFTSSVTCGGVTSGSTAAIGAAVPCNGAAATSRIDNVYSLGLNYENGPVYVGYAYTEVDGNTGGVKTKAVSNRVAGYFKFGTAQIGALFDQTDADKHASNNKRNVWQLNGKFGIGAGNIIAGYGQAKDLDGLDNTGAKQYFVGYEHSLSKRTILKAIYSEVRNESGAAYNFYNGATGEVTGVVAGSDPKALQVGIRHSF